MFYLDCRSRGSNILLRYIGDDGIEKTLKYNQYKPSLFRKAYHGESSEYSTLIGSEPLVRVQFDNMWEANQKLRESDISYHGNRNFHYTFIHQNFDNTEDYDETKIRTFIIDIECPSDKGFPQPSDAEWEINALTIYDNIRDKYFVWGLGEFDVDDSNTELLDNGIDPSKVVYKGFDSEVALLADMLSFWRTAFPVAVSGWNSSNFDLPYLYNRMQKLGLDPNKLSPWGIATLREWEKFGKTQLTVNILGVNDLDYLELYRKNRFIERPSYKLGYISEIELGTTKVDFAEEAANLRTLHKVNWQKYIIYNIVDVDLVKRLDDKLGFMGITFAVAYFAGINYDSVKSVVATWENLIYRDVIDSGVILPPKKDNDHVGYAGAYVRAPEVGKHQWVVSQDLTSLYPMLVIQYNISPETLSDDRVDGVSVDGMLDRMDINILDNHCVCPTGNMFNTEKQGVFPKIMQHLFNDRKARKDAMLEHETHAVAAELEMKKRGLL